MTYRLNLRDEADVRWAFSEDLRGDNGTRSIQSNFEIRSIYKPIVNVRELRCGPVEVTMKRAKKSAAVIADQDETMLRSSSRERVVFGALQALGQANHEALQTTYGYAGGCGGLVGFDDVAALAMLTNAAQECRRREQHHAKHDLSVFEALLDLCTRVRSKGDKASESDRALWQAIYEEADTRLSRACREYTRRAADARSAESRARGVA